MQTPFFLGIDVAHEPRFGFDADRAQLRDQIPHPEFAMLQRLFDFDPDTTMVHRAQRFEAAVALGGYASDGWIGVRNRDADQLSQEGGIKVRQVAGDQQIPFRFGGAQSGVQPGHRPAAWKEIRNHRQPEMAVPGRVAEQGDRSGCFEDRKRNRLDQRLAGVGQQRLVAAHPAALPAHQDEARDSSACRHEKIIASRLILPVYWKRNVFVGNCLNQIGIITMMFACANSFAQSSRPAGTRTASTVAADHRTGRLVRTVVVAPRMVEPKVIEPVEVSAAEPAGPDPSINELVEQSARMHGVDPLLVHSVIKTESNYNPNAISNKGAQGLMQLMPATARDLGVKNPMNPRENIEGGVKYLKRLQLEFSDPALALAAYNAGEGAVRRYNWIPPYPETQDYVVKVARNYRQAKAAAAAQSAPPQVPKAAVLPVQTANKQMEAPAEPPPAPLQYYYDARGRLNLRTVK